MADHRLFTNTQVGTAQRLGQHQADPASCCHFLPLLQIQVGASGTQLTQALRAGAPLSEGGNTVAQHLEHAVLVSHDQLWHSHHSFAGRPAAAHW
ncbi:hypothetical protein D3C76_1361620 [compost metagenome]